MVQFTLFELHVDDVEFGDAPFARTRRSEETEPTSEEDESAGSAVSGIASKLAGILFVAALVYGLRRFLGGRGDDEEAEFEAAETSDPLAAD